jgi:hypothetical protein
MKVRYLQKHKLIVEMERAKKKSSFEEEKKALKMEFE